jgi:hypothetical protein
MNLHNVHVGHLRGVSADIRQGATVGAQPRLLRHSGGDDLENESGRG